MILRLSGKLAKKLSTVPDEAIPAHGNPFLDWSGHVFRVGRVQYILLTNTRSLYSVLFPGRGITRPDLYEEHAREQIRLQLERDGFGWMHDRFLAPDPEAVSYSRALNRHVTGSMNDMIFHAGFLIEEKEMSLDEVTHFLNHMPMSYLEDVYPDRSLEALAREMVWDRLAVCGAPLMVRAEEDNLDSTDVSGGLSLSPDPELLLVSLEDACRELGRPTAESGTQRPREATQALLLALKLHFPSFFEEHLAGRELYEDVLSDPVHGRIIRMKRVAAASLADYL